MAIVPSGLQSSSLKPRKNGLQGSYLCFHVELMRLNFLSLPPDFDLCFGGPLISFIFPRQFSLHPEYFLSSHSMDQSAQHTFYFLKMNKVLSSITGDYLKLTHTEFKCCHEHSTVSLFLLTLSLQHSFLNMFFLYPPILYS